MNVIIVEDEKAAAEALISFLERYGTENSEEFNVVHFKDAVTFLSEYNSQSDIIFMDIMLPNLNGMDASRKLREIDKNVALIFVTNMAQFAVKGYDVGAWDFIVKPVSYPNFALKLERTLNKLENNKDIPIWISGKTGKRRMLTSRIKYVEVTKHIVTYHTVDGDITVSGTMKAVEQQLNGISFALCNQCYLINLRFVSEVSGFSVIVGGDTLQISHPKKKEFVRALNMFLNGGK